MNNLLKEEIVSRCVTHFFKKQLNENTNDRRVNKLISLYYPDADFNKIRQIRADFLNYIPNARSRNEKWLYTVLKWYLDGDIPKEEVKRLDRFLGWLNSNELNDDEINNGDWHDLPFMWVKQTYDKIFPPKENNVKIGTNNNKLKRINDNNKLKRINGFTIRRIDSQEEARSLGDAVYNGEWCILDNLFNEEVDDCTCYIISNNKTYNRATPTPLRKIISEVKKLGYNDIANELKGFLPRNIDVSDIAGDCFEEYFDIADMNNGLPPYDKYGLSAIVVLIGGDKDLWGVYSRYNMPNMFDGHFLDEMELSKLIGMDIHEACPYVER